ATVTEVGIIIARWDDWTLLPDAVDGVIGRVGGKREGRFGLTLINQSWHSAQLEMVRIAPDDTPAPFPKTEQRNIYAPFNPREGTCVREGTCGVPGRSFVRGVVKLVAQQPSQAPPDAPDRDVPAPVTSATSPSDAKIGPSDQPSEPAVAELTPSSTLKKRPCAEPEPAPPNT